jgi:hypothetical protein
MKFLKVFIIVTVTLAGYVWFQRNINMPVYDHFISRHVATFDHMINFQNRNDVDYIIIGDSTGLHNIRPKKLTVQADNLCLSGASLLDTYTVLKRINIKKVRKGIILSTSFYASSHYDKHLWERFISTDFYSFSELWDLYKSSALTGTFPSSELSLPAFVLKVAISKLYLFPDAIKAFASFPIRFIKKRKTELYFKNTIAKENGYLPHPVAYPVPAELYDESYRSFYSHPFVIDGTDLFYLKKIIEFSKNEGLKLYILSPILADKVRKLNAKPFEDSFSEYFKKFVQNEQGVEFIILPVSDKSEDFFDFNHLNEIGADKFAPIISSSINKR